MYVETFIPNKTCRAAQGVKMKTPEVRTRLTSPWHTLDK